MGTLNYRTTDCGRITHPEVGVIRLTPASPSATIRSTDRILVTNHILDQVEDFEMAWNRPRCFLSMIIAGLAGLVIYRPFESTKWQTPAGIFACGVAYTILVFGTLRSFENSRVFADRNSCAVRRIVIGHLLFVAVIAGILWFGIWVTPRLPYWLDEPLGVSRSGRPASTAFEMLQAATLLVVLGVECLWLELDARVDGKNIEEIRNDLAQRLG